MTQRGPTETAIKLTYAKQHLSKVINQVARGESRVVVEKSGLPVAAIISMEEYRRFKEQESASQERRSALFAKLAQFSDAFDSVSDEELERELANARAELRGDRQA